MPVQLVDVSQAIITLDRVCPSQSGLASGE
jgi:hypothetical protein